MQRPIWLLKMLLRAACFFGLFAFALNNQHDVTVNFFFGTDWRVPLVLLVLAVFAAGVLLGALGMAPRWWRRRRTAVDAGTAPAADPPQMLDAGAAAPTPGAPHGP